MSEWVAANLLVVVSTLGDKYEAYNIDNSIQVKLRCRNIKATKEVTIDYSDCIPPWRKTSLNYIYKYQYTKPTLDVVSPGSVYE